MILYILPLGVLHRGLLTGIYLYLQLQPGIH
jgi:hypothetical protein